MLQRLVGVHKFCGGFIPAKTRCSGSRRPAVSTGGRLGAATKGPKGRQTNPRSPLRHKYRNRSVGGAFNSCRSTDQQPMAVQMRGL